jgi:hypothetical protein
MTEQEMKQRTKADFISKTGITEAEADESLYWLEWIAGPACCRRSA